MCKVVKAIFTLDFLLLTLVFGSMHENDKYFYFTGQNLNIYYEKFVFKMKK